MTCPKEALADHVYGFLERGREVPLRVHLEGCGACRGEVARLRREHDLFDAALGGVRSGKNAGPSRARGRILPIAFAAGLLLAISATFGLPPGRWLRRGGKVAEDRVSVGRPVPSVGVTLESAGSGTYRLRFHLDDVSAFRTPNALVVLDPEVRDARGVRLPVLLERVSLRGASRTPSLEWAATYGGLTVSHPVRGGSVRGRAKLLVPRLVEFVEIDLSEERSERKAGPYPVECRRTASDRVELSFPGPGGPPVGRLVLGSVRVDGRETSAVPKFGVGESWTDGVSSGVRELYLYQVAVAPESRRLVFDFISEATESEFEFVAGPLAAPSE